MTDLMQARKRIDEIDKQLAKLFEERMTASAAIAEYKRGHGLSIEDKAREQEIIDHNRAYISNKDVESYYVRLLESMMTLSKDYQSRLLSGMKVAYSGVEGAYGYIAAQKLFPGCETVKYADFASTYAAVENGECDCAVLPLENSYAGEVGDVMDLIFSGSLYVNQVLDLDINHCLLGKKGKRKSDIKTVISHRQALDQCEGYLRRLGAESKTFSNTAAAAQYVKESDDPSVAAIASAAAAEIFGLDIIESNINTSRNNTTRFAVFSRSQNTPAKVQRDNEYFILTFTVRNQAGALASTLNIIGAHGFNMRNLRSRPMKELLWNYYFYIEAEGCINTEDGRDMLRELSAVCAQLRLAGTYFKNNIKEEE